MQDKIELIIFKTKVGKYAFKSIRQLIDVLKDDKDDEGDCLEAICSKYGTRPEFKTFKKEDIENYNDEISLLSNVCEAYNLINLTWR